jgi:proteasome lid subunit RPN8/RPN11
LTDYLELASTHWQAMSRDVVAAAPLEACGLLAGRIRRVELVLEMRNVLESRVRFQLDPREQLQAFDQIERRGMDLLGIYHSHPAGPEEVSPTDVAESAYDVVHVVWSCPHGIWNGRGFRIRGGKAVEVELRVVE